MPQEQLCSLSFELKQCWQSPNHGGHSGSLVLGFSGQLPQFPVDLAFLSMGRWFLPNCDSVYVLEYVVSCGLESALAPGSICR